MEMYSRVMSRPLTILPEVIYKSGQNWNRADISILTKFLPRQRGLRTMIFLCLLCTASTQLWDIKAVIYLVTRGPNKHEARITPLPLSSDIYLSSDFPTRCYILYNTGNHCGRAQCFRHFLQSH